MSKQKGFLIGGRELRTDDPRQIRLILNDIIRKLLDRNLDPNERITPEEARTVKQICDSQLQCLDREKQSELEKELEELRKLVRGEEE